MPEHWAMKKSTGRILAASILTIAGAANAADKRPFQDEAHFKAAVLHQKDLGNGVVADTMTGFTFVLVKIVDDRTGKSWTGCTTAQYLEDAIHIENHLDYDDASWARGRQVILDSKDHTFHFSKPKALEMVGAYDASDLKRARRFVHDHGVASLKEGVSRSKIGGDIAALNQTALACAVIESGYSAYMGDRIPYIYAEP